MRQNNTLHTFSIIVSFSSIGQKNSKLQKQISKILTFAHNQLTYDINFASDSPLGLMQRTPSKQKVLQQNQSNILCLEIKLYIYIYTYSLVYLLLNKQQKRKVCVYLQCTGISSILRGNTTFRINTSNLITNCVSNTLVSGSPQHKMYKTPKLTKVS